MRNRLLFIASIVLAAATAIGFLVLVGKPINYSAELGSMIGGMIPK